MRTECKHSVRQLLLQNLNQFVNTPNSLKASQTWSNANYFRLFHTLKMIGNCFVIYILACNLVETQYMSFRSTLVLFHRTEVFNMERWKERISIDPNACHGKPCI